MTRVYWFALLIGLLALTGHADADIVLDWNQTMRDVMKSDGIHEVNHANPGWSTRSFAMVNGAIYDAFQSLNRTHAPFLYTPTTSGASLEAAVHQAARDILVECYDHLDEVAMIESVYSARMSNVADGVEKTAGMTLGSAIAHHYKVARESDGLKEGSNYMPLTGPGYWRPDPWNPGQIAWGPQWGTVSTFAIGNTTPYIDALPPLPSLESPEYAAAYNQVMNYGALDEFGPAHTPTSRTADQTEIGLFWAYDRRSMGPPPVLFNRNLAEIAEAIGNSTEDNARLFAMASVAQADASVAAWDAKFKYNFWRPVAGIQEGDTDNNPLTEQDLDWRPLGAPGASLIDIIDDFTPPFPAWTSGHATMGASVFRTLELFYGTNDFALADAAIGDDAITDSFVLTSEEEGGGGTRSFAKFAHDSLFALESPTETPDWENTASRIFLGVHWLMDQRDGMTLGHNIAADIAAMRFQAVPEPTAAMLLTALAGAFVLQCRRRS